MRLLGNRWRILAWKREGQWGTDRIELEGDGASEFDELVIGNETNPCWFHLEQMSDRDWWFAFYLNGSDRICGNMRVFHTKPNEFSIWSETNDAHESYSWPKESNE